MLAVDESLFLLDIVFTQSGTERMIPIPVVIKNYQTLTNSPNQNGLFLSLSPSIEERVSF